MDRRLASTWEEREAARVAAARERHAALRDRFLRPRVRNHGRDEAALALQVAERRAAREREREEDVQYAQSVAAVQERMAAAERERAAQERDEAARRRENWELAAALKAAKREAEREEDRRLVAYGGPASMKEFDGEDLAARERRALQAAQMRLWAAQQAEERRIRDEAERKAELDYADHAARFSGECERLEQQRRDEHQRALRDLQAFNQQAAMSKRAMAEHERQLERRAEADERPLSDLNTHVSKNVLSPSRHRPDHFTGFSRDDLRGIRAQQEDQMRDKEARMARERAEEAAFARQQAATLEAAKAAALQEQRDRALANRAYLDDQRRQADDKRRRELQARQAEGPAIAADFFTGFGRSHR